MTDVLAAKPLSPRLGVLVEQCDVGSPLTPDVIASLRALLRRHKLLLFRGVRLDAAEQRRLLGAFGAVIDEKEDGRYYSIVDNRIAPDSDQGDECIYHCDYSFKPMPLALVSLFGITIPERCAPTRFVNGVRACEELAPDLRAKLEGKYVLHASDVVTAAGESAGPIRPEDLERRSYAGTLHPAIFTHPVTREPILFINEYLCVQVDGVSRVESDDILAAVYAHLYAEDRVYEHHWRAGDLIVFDNLALQHKRVRGGPRILRRMIAQ
jgi:taurine dioxygenase